MRNWTDQKDTAYIERSGGNWKAWSYSDGQRVMLSTGRDKFGLPNHLADTPGAAIRFLESHNYRVVVVK